jgi:NAD-dependent DNA ligase
MQNELLSKWHFKTTPYFFVAENIDEVIHEIERLTLDRPTFDFEID